MQAGDDEVLRRMRREYTADDYRSLVTRIRATIPGVSIATDIIVGFPGETDAQFQRTHELLAELRVDVAHLADFILDVEAIFARHDLVAGIYGHAGSGNLHLRPLFDITDLGLPGLLARVADEVYVAVFRYDGTITAEHGMGRLRVPYLAREWGETIIGYMRRVKEVFDPDDLLNPEVMFSDRALTDDLKPIT